MLRDLVRTFTEHGFSVSDVAVERPTDERRNGDHAVTVRLEVRGGRSLTSLASDLDDLNRVLEVSAAEDKRLAW